jgi:phage shock protein PspC (stress-responsive transcriptional regulator)
MVGGVAGGLAEHLGIDALLWRIGFVALTLAGGSGVLVYLLLWVLMPPAAADPQQPVSPVERLVVRLHDAVRGSALVTGRR